MEFRLLGGQILAKRLGDRDEVSELSLSDWYVPLEETPLLLHDFPVSRGFNEPVEAVVISVGSGTRVDGGPSVPLSVGVGDRVLVAKGAGSGLSLEGTMHLILRESDLLAR